MISIEFSRGKYTYFLEQKEMCWYYQSASKSRLTNSEQFDRIRRRFECRVANQVNVSVSTARLCWDCFEDNVDRMIVGVFFFLVTVTQYSNAWYLFLHRGLADTCKIYSHNRIDRNRYNFDVFVTYFCCLFLYVFYQTESHIAPLHECPWWYIVTFVENLVYAFIRLAIWRRL